MTLDEYQTQAMTTELMQRSQNPKASEPAFIAKILGLVGEAGEVAEKIKKIVRDKEGVISNEDKLELQKELGDVLWYIAALSDYLGLRLDDVGAQNLSKLASRKNRGELHGKGDNR